MSIQNRFAVYRIDVLSTLASRPQKILNLLPTLGIIEKVELKIIDLYFLEGILTPGFLQEIAEALICDPVTNQYHFQQLDPDRVLSLNTLSAPLNNPDTLSIEVVFRPGVTDNTAKELLLAAQKLGITKLTSAATGIRYEFSGPLSETELHRVAGELLVNTTIQRYATGSIYPKFVHPSQQVSDPELISLHGLEDSGLLALSAERRLALNLEEMLSIQAYFHQNGRSPTDAELETLAQTWSEHCVHKTFQAEITLNDRLGRIQSILHTYLKSATDQISAPWVRSAFVDNAGVIAFDEEYDLSFKVETHNHPSAIEPFGGANTGVGGVVRDILGVSHRPIANTDVLCFGPIDTDQDTLSPGVLHPRRVCDGVVSGIEDYGNKLGLPTVNGAVIFHPGYTATPLVYCGCVGLGPVDSHPRTPQPEDRIILVGGRTGRDGLRGATFSSLTMDAQTGQVAGASVQIGDPITEKGVIEVVVRARDQKLYHAITDCGAGGLSSAVGEMASAIGARVDLAAVHLKYSGLAPWEIWLSEAQERMVLAVPPDNLPFLEKICETYEVEWADIGTFQPTGRLQVFYGDIPVVDLDNEFLHHCPSLRLKAEIHEKVPEAPSSIPVRGDPPTESQLLLTLLAHPSIASKEDIIRVFDHEVRGATVIKPLVGREADGPSDAAVLKPLETKGWKGFVLANGINPVIGEMDPYAMAISAIDEAVRNAVAVGGDPERLALLDNFCWGDPHRPEDLGALVRAAQGCREGALHFQTPFISGKDSLNNEYVAPDGKRYAIPGTLLISSLAIHHDVRKSITMGLKEPGNDLYLLGPWTPALGGSHALRIAGEGFFMDTPVCRRVPVLPVEAPDIYRILHKAIHDGLISAAHDLSEGGLGVATVEMALAGRLGFQLDITPLHADPKQALFAESNGCLIISAKPEHGNLLERRFRDWPLQWLGRVTPTPRLIFCHQEASIINLPLTECLAAFKAFPE